MTASLGAYEPIVPPVEQALSGDVDWSWHPFTDGTWPLRGNTLRARMRAKIPKLFGWQLVPGADVYLWADGAFSYRHATDVAWWLDALGPAEFVCYRHNERGTVAEEAAFLRDVVPRSRGMARKYGGEDLDGQMAALDEDGYVDDRLYNAGLFAYRPTPRVQAAMWAWWASVTRWHVNDQLSLPWALRSTEVRVRVLEGDIYACPAATRVGRPVRPRA